MNPSGKDIDLPEDILFILAKDYVSERDGLSLALSSENFASVYGYNRTSLDIQRSYFLHSLSPTWDRFFQKHIDPSHLSSFDASHCYWLPADSLVHCITRMANLMELNIQDTKIALGHLPQIFKASNSIIKLGFTLAEKNLDRFKEGVMEEEALHLMTQGFAKLLHLRVFTFALDDITYVESWLVILGVLRWCHDCIDLFIKIANPEGGKRLLPGEFEFQLGLIPSVDVSRLGWMVNLRSLVILSDDSPDVVEHWMLRQFLSVLREQNHLERLWLSWLCDNYNQAEFTILTGPLVKTLQLAAWDNPDFELDLNAEQFHHLEHLSGLPFSRLDQFPNLKDFRGYCSPDDEGLNDFCQSHTNLERLHVNMHSHDRDAIMRPLGKGDWNLLKLKVLVLNFWNINLPNGIDYLIQVCPRIQEFHLNSSCWKPRDRLEVVQLFSSIRLDRLIWLNITEPNLFDGSYLPAIIGQCPKLERIHLECDQLESDFFSHLAECLPAATNLRDLRLKWCKNGKMDASHLELFGQALLKCSSHLERLVLLNEMKGRDDDPHKMTLLPDFLLPFVTKMTHLVALYIIGFRWDPSQEEVEALKQRFTREILASRPAFRMQVGPLWAIENDLDMPRIHYDEILFPMNVDHTPPRF